MIITGSQNIAMAQLIAVRGAIKLEKLGMKHSGGSIRKGWAVKLGLKPNAKHDEVIAKINSILDADKLARGIN